MADDRANGAIELLKEMIDKLLAEVAEKKKMANQFAEIAGLPKVYDDIDEPQQTAGANLRPDMFANFSAPSAAARAFLEWRTAAKGATTADVIYEALVKGGYSFGASNASDAKNNLRIAMGKDREVRRLPNGAYGLWDWYPNAKRDDEPARVAAPRVTRAPRVSERSGEDIDSSPTEPAELPEGEK